MATPVNDSYSNTESNKIAGGKFLLPDWVPPVGVFSDVSLNTLAAVRPAGWPSNDVSGPFLNWAGGFFNPDFSSRGAFITRGSGHLTAAQPVWGGNWAFDFVTRKWEGCNIPGSPLLEYGPNTAYYNAYYESLTSTSLGHPYVPHTYDGLVYRSKANGGGNKGNLISNFSPGGVGVPQTVHEYDLSSTVNPPVRLIDNLPAGTSYPMSATDDKRKGYWVMSNNGQAPLIFVPFDNPSSYVMYQLGYGTYGDNSLIYLPEHDCLVGMGRGNSANTTFDMYVCPIVNNVPQGFVVANQVGTPPVDGRCGGVWSTILRCIVSYEGGGSKKVHRLAPPAVGSNLSTGSWTWTNETVTGDVGQDPSRPGTNPNSGLPYVENGVWSRFVEVPKLRSFAWVNGVDAPVQLWRLKGME